LPFLEIVVSSYRSQAARWDMLEELDAKIIRLLIEDSKQSRKLIADKIGISESYLSKKIEKLISNERHRRPISKFTIKINDDLVGLNVSAITLIKLASKQSSNIDQIIEKFRTIDAVTDIYLVLGDWDIYVHWKAKSNTEIIDGIKSALDENDIGNTVTLMLSKSMKADHVPDFAINEA
jgi:DNA-binding Lrp family transcriptional regulator